MERERIQQVLDFIGEGTLPYSEREALITLVQSNRIVEKVFENVLEYKATAEWN